MGQPKMVFVDDDPDDRELVEDCLLNNAIKDYMILESGSILFAYLELSKIDLLPDLIVLDLNMPIMSGYDVLLKLKSDERYSHIPVVLFTTTYKNPLVDKCMLLGALAYFKKPNTISIMSKVLNEIFEHGMKR